MMKSIETQTISHKRNMAVLVVVASALVACGGGSDGSAPEPSNSNAAPVAVADAASTDEDTPVTTGNVLGNDTDAEGDALSVSAVDAASANGGTVSNNDDGTFTYTPAANWNGTDSFTYTVSDGYSTDVGTVTVTVSAVNDAPTAATAAITTTMNNASAGVTPDVTDVDLTNEGDSYTLAIAAQPANGTASVVGNLLVYTPAADYSGADSFTFAATDSGGLSVTGTASVTVAPGAAAVWGSFNWNSANWQ